jgi:hypothetical protein
LPIALPENATFNSFNLGLRNILYKHHIFKQTAFLGTGVLFDGISGKACKSVNVKKKQRLATL